MLSCGVGLVLPSPTVGAKIFLQEIGWLQQQQCLLVLLLLRAPIAPNYIVPGEGSCRHSDAGTSMLKSV